MDCSTGHVYVCEGGAGLVKVGRSANPERRLQAIRTSIGSVGLKSWVSPKLFGYKKLESAVHARLQQWRVAGEWFSCSMEDAIAAVEELSCMCHPEDHLPSIEAARAREVERAATQEEILKMICRTSVSAGSSLFRDLTSMAGVLLWLKKVQRVTTDHIAEALGGRERDLANPAELFLKIILNNYVSAISTMVDMQGGRIAYVCENLQLQEAEHSELLSRVMSAATMQDDDETDPTQAELTEFWAAAGMSWPPA